MYKYWGNLPGKGEKNPELLFVDPRPHVKRKLDKGFLWAIIERTNNKVIGVFEIFDVVSPPASIVQEKWIRSVP